MMAAEHDIEVSSGTSVLWDAGQPTFTPPLDIQNAAVLLARVISRPTGNRICLDLGHKAVASEMQPPRVTLFGLEEARAVMHSEEHLVLETERAGDFPPGTVLYGVPTHICPTVALQSEVWCVRNQRATEKWPVVARTRCLTI
jgi:D-serine deaminase-like pyridoxal phosphate-dependent protein